MRPSGRVGNAQACGLVIRDRLHGDSGLEPASTGSKYCPPVPQGFYYAADQVPAATEEKRAACFSGRRLADAPRNARPGVCGARPNRRIFRTLLGTEFPFEHLTTADTIYEAELRTGVGAHFRYAKHLRDALALPALPVHQGIGSSKAARSRNRGENNASAVGEKPRPIQINLLPAALPTLPPGLMAVALPKK